MPWTKPYRPPKSQRLDPALYEQPGRITFITIRAYRHQTPFVNPELNRIVLGTLRESVVSERCLVFTYCLMPDHLHFLASPQEPGNSTLSFTEAFKGRSTNASWKVGWKGKLWQPRFYDHLVRSSESLEDITNYILANPVRKELADAAENWPWSGQLSHWPGPW